MMPLLWLMDSTDNTGLVFDLGMDSNYESTDSGNPASLAVNILRDGTWTITVGSGDSLVGTPSSGTWAASPNSTVGDNYEVQFTTSNLANSPTVSNGASSFTAVTSTRTITISKGAFAVAGADVTVNLRRSGFGPTELTETTSITINTA